MEGRQEERERKGGEACHAGGRDNRVVDPPSP
jgi:hypothetical protein